MRLPSASPFRRTLAAFPGCDGYVEALLDFARERPRPETTRRADAHLFRAPAERAAFRPR